MSALETSAAAIFLSFVAPPPSVPLQSQAELKAIVEALGPGESVRIGSVLFTMNQRQAGVPDADGWYPAQSLGGGFVVRMPVPYNDFTTVAPAKDGGTVTTDAVGGRSEEGARFVVNCIRRSDGSVEAGWATTVAQSLLEGEPSGELHPVDRAGVVGVEVRIHSESRGLFLGQFLRVGDRRCQLSVEHSVAEATTIEDAARVFLDSFSPSAHQ